MISANPKNGSQQPRTRKYSGKVMDISTVAEEFFGGSRRSVESKVARRLLPFKKLGGRVIFLRSELDEFFLKLNGTSIDEALANNEDRTQVSASKREEV